MESDSVLQNNYKITFEIEETTGPICAILACPLCPWRSENRGSTGGF
jgi:hypothetical protein